jgi:hypothetical protein
MGHRSGRDRVSFAIRELNHHTKQIPSHCCLSKDIVDRILSLGLGSLHQGSTKAYLFYLFRFYPVRSDVVDPIFRPDQLVNLHDRIIQPGMFADNKNIVFYCVSVGVSRLGAGDGQAVSTTRIWSRITRIAARPIRAIRGNPCRALAFAQLAPNLNTPGDPSRLAPGTGIE